MASVPLKFKPPADEGIAALHIEEAPAMGGPWAEIEEVLAVGTYPDYIAEYTTQLATSAVGWFRIRWRDAEGAFTPYSQPVQGGTELLIALVKDRVMQRDPSLVDAIVYQEVEAVISEYFNTDNPYDSTLTANYRVINGLVYMALARSILFTSIKASVENVESATIGLVSYRSGTKNVQNVQRGVEALLDLANEWLGISKSFVMVLEEVASNGRISGYDHSRLAGFISVE